MIYEEDYDGDDKPIAQRIVRVMFAEPKWNYSTSINGTRKEITNFFWGAPLHVSHREDVIKTPNRLEFPLPDGPTIVAVLPTRHRGQFLHRGYIISYEPKPIPGGACDWEYVVHSYDGPEDGRCGTAASKDAAIALVDELIAEIVASKC